MILYMIGKLAPNLSHLTRRLVKYIPGRNHFRAVPSQNGDKYVTSPPPPIVELDTIVLIFLLCLVALRMAFNISVQYNGGLLPDIILLVQGYYSWGTRLNTMYSGFVFTAYVVTVYYYCHVL